MTLLSRNCAHFIPAVNQIHERALFHSRSQKEGENFEGYLRSLYELSEFCGFDKREESIRDRLVLGIRDKDLSENFSLHQI
jgi:hypothetical protein